MQTPGTGTSKAEGTACTEAQGVCARQCEERQAHVSIGEGQEGKGGDVQDGGFVRLCL